MPLHDVAPEPVCRPHGALQIHLPTGHVFAEQRPALRGLDHVDREGPFHDPLDGETRAVDGDALARLEAPVGSADPQHEAGFPFPLPPSPAFPPLPQTCLTPPMAPHVPGNLSRLSNT